MIKSLEVTLQKKMGRLNLGLEDLDQKQYFLTKKDLIVHIGILGENNYPVWIKFLFMEITAEA